MRSPRRPESVTVTCIACGNRVPRSGAREYDRFGDRWVREGKEFEYLCKQCHDLECHLPRSELEATLLAVGSDHRDPTAFVRAYYRTVSERASGEETNGV